MNMRQISQLLNARVLCGEERLDEDVPNVFASDMMSDILACPEEIAFMLTGLVNQQVIRTADMMDIGLIVFVRGKEPQDDLLAMARDRGMVLMVTALGMYSACGQLYAQGLEGAYQ